MAGNEVARRPQAGAVVTPRDISNITFEDARIFFRNFSGKEGQYNREGDRNFCLALDPRDAQQMEADGWNVKHLRPREEDEEPQAYVQVSVSFKNRPPTIVLVTSKNKTRLPEETIDMLDYVEIAGVDLIITPYQWAVSNKTGIKAYLKSIYITIVEDELELKYAEVPDAISALNSVIATSTRIELNDDDESIIFGEMID